VVKATGQPAARLLAPTLAKAAPSLERRRLMPLRHLGMQTGNAAAITYCIQQRPPLLPLTQARTACPATPDGRAGAAAGWVAWATRLPGCCRMLGGGRSRPRPEGRWGGRTGRMARARVRALMGERITGEPGTAGPGVSARAPQKLVMV